MFFSKGQLEKLPKKLQEELELFYNKYERAHDLYDEGKNVDIEMIKCVTYSLKIYLKWEKKVDKKTRDLISEGIGEIPIMIMIDKIGLSNELRDIISPLVDIDVSHANLHINRKKLIEEILQKLNRIKEEYSKKEN